MFEHMAWADARTISAVAANTNNGQRASALRLLGHLVAAERVWLLRVRGEAPDCPIWPEWPLERIEELAAANAAAFGEMVSALTDEEAGGLVEYRNSQGVAFQNSVRDILTHVALHGSYHRGQIAMTLRAGGADPVNTDFITYAREHSATR